MLAGLVTALAAGLFIADLSLPLGVAAYFPYLAVVGLSLGLSTSRYTYATAAVCTAFIALGQFFSPSGEVPLGMAAVNRMLAIGLLWLVALAGNRILQLQHLNQKLQLEISEQWRAEERLREQASLLDLTPHAVMVRDLQHRILFWNRGAERAYGWTSQEAVGQNALDLLFLQHKPELAQASARLQESGEWVGEFHHKTKDGRHITVEAHWVLVRGQQGQPKSILVVNTDVTDKKNLQPRLLRTQRLESVGVLASGIAHDFNNLLTPILMATKLLQEERDQEERQHLLTTLQASAERGAEVIRQLLAFTGGTDSQQTVVQLRHVLKEVKSILDHTFPKTIQIAMMLPDDLPPVMGDTTQLSQVFMNLCVNARDAMPIGGALTITATQVILDQKYARHHLEALPGPYVAVCVADSGSGIPPQVLDKVFDPFFTTKAQDRGTGLGLSTALGIIKGFGGFMDVASALGQGTRFTFFLPIHKTGPAEPISQEVAPSPEGQGELILVVDDEANILDIARTALQAHGYRVATAGSGAEALAAYQQQPQKIGAVLLDLMMAQMDGAATMRALRKLDPDVRIIASSGLLPRGQLGEAIAAGELAFLQKPYTDQQILDMLARVLQPS